MLSSDLDAIKNIFNSKLNHQDQSCLLIASENVDKRKSDISEGTTKTLNTFFRCNHLEVSKVINHLRLCSAMLIPSGTGIL